MTSCSPLDGWPKSVSLPFLTSIQPIQVRNNDMTIKGKDVKEKGDGDGGDGRNICWVEQD